MTVEAPTRTLPQNIEAEKSVLGAILATGSSAMDAVVDYLKPEDFIRDAHQRIFVAFLALLRQNVAIDLLTLRDELQRSGDLDRCGGAAYIAQLGDGVPHATNLPYYARIVKAHAQRRSVIYAANKLLTKAYEHDGEIPELLDEAERALLELSGRTAPGDLVSAEELVRRVYPVIEQLSEARRHVTGIGTGFAELDRFTRGMQPGNLWILAGRPGQGKSTLGTQIAAHVARTHPVAFFSLEMNSLEITFRLLSTIAKVDGHALQCGQLSMFDQQAVGAALAELSSLGIHVDDSSTLSALQVRSKARRQKAKTGLGLIVVDYVQRLKHPKADTDEARLAATSDLLLTTARELAVPMLVMCQLSRAPEKRQDQRPGLSDLRGSGALEQDAHVVLAIHRPQKKDAGPDPFTELLILKQRNGPTTDIDLRWIPEQYRFADVEA